MKNVFKVVSVVMSLALLVGILAATGLLASADESEAIASWSDKGGLNYTYYWEGRAFANLYSYCEGTNGTWGDFAAKIAEIPENQYVKVILTGTFTGVTKDNALMSSRVWNETAEKFAADSATENEVVFRVQGPLTSKLQDPNIDFTFNADMEGISEMANTHVTVMVFEGDAEVAATATEAEAEETDPQTDKTDPESTETEPVVTDPESTETEPVVTDPTDPTEPTEPTKPVVLLYGDANGDNEINMKDVLTLRKHLAGMEVEINMTLADATGDDEINMKDVLALRKYLAGMDQTLGK